VEKETRIEAELKITDAAVKAPGASEAVVPEGTEVASAPQQHGHPPEPADPAWTDEAYFAVSEQALPPSGARPVVAAAGDGNALQDKHRLVVLGNAASRVASDDGGRSLARIRMVALWVTLALFIVFPNLLTLGLLVVALAWHASRFLQMVRGMMLEQWGYAAITLLGTGLRFWDLGLKPLHHDESLHAYYSMQLFQDASTYHYDPLLHGPFQFHAIAYVYYVASHLGVADGGVNDVTARTAAAMLGSAMIPMCYFLRGWLGNVGTLLAGFLLAVSPIFVYYSRFTREDIYFASLTFATVVTFFKFCEARRLRWLLICAGAFVLSYATKEAAFFTIAIFGGILGGFIAWEFGSRSVYPSARVEREADDEGAAAPARLRLPLGLNEHAGVPALLMYFGLAGILAKIVLTWVGTTSRYLAGADVKGDQAVVQARLDQANQTVQNIETAVVAGLLIVLVAMAVLVLVVVLRKLFTNPSSTPGSGALERRGLGRWIDPLRQPLLNGLVRIPLAHWCFALLVAFVLFSALFWIVPSHDHSVCPPGGAPPANGSVCSWSQGFLQGMGTGLVQGIYYWVQQQQVARGGQPWYYYLLLIPMYEQLMVIFGIGGLIRCLARPTRFRLFVVIWFLASLFLYSWASEKMPWLALHILLPLLLLAAIALEWALAKMLDLVDNLAQHRLEGVAVIGRRYGGALLSLVGGFLLLLPMLHSMLFVTFLDPGEAPHEMLSYVQTTPDVTLVMGKIEALDRELYHGQHLLKIGVDNDSKWPFAWYLRDYSCVGYGYPDNDPTATVFCNGRGYPPDVLLMTPYATNDAQFFTTPDPAKPHPLYLAKRYRLRAWWDEGYKPLPTCGCVSNPNALSYGDGLGQWLSYGDTPPPLGKAFDLGKAVGNLWAWLWTRQPIGSANGSTDFLFLVQSDLPMTP